MSEKRFTLSNFASPSQLSDVCDDGGKMLNSEVVDLLNGQLSIIRRDEMSIRTMMSNMEKLEDENEQLRQKLKSVTMLKDDYEELIESFEKKYEEKD